MNKTLKYSLITLAAIAAAGGAFFVYKKRKGISNIAKKAIDVAQLEFDAWNTGGTQRKEGDSSVYDRLKKYWQEGADIFWTKTKMINEAWSAAFISYVMRKAGAGDNFKYSPSHSVYIRDAIKNRKENNDNPFKGYRPEEVKVSKGDLVCYPRQNGVGYDTTGAYASHCDLVVDVQKNVAIAVGGNVSNSVSKTEYSIDDEGKVNEKKVFVVIKNKK